MMAHYQAVMAVIPSSVIWLLLAAAAAVVYMVQIIKTAAGCQVLLVAPAAVLL
jgi:hypothetical protein